MSRCLGPGEPWLQRRLPARSDRMVLGLLAPVLALVLSACGSSVRVPTAVASPPTDVASTSDPPDAAQAEIEDDAVQRPGIENPRADRSAGSVVSVDLPAVPLIELPDLSALGDTGDLVNESLGELIGPNNGVDVVGGQCQEDGGEPVYQGSSTETNIFEIETDGSGSYREQHEHGLVTLEVSGDGSGRFYQETRTGLVTIDVEPDGSGRYYSKQGGTLTTVERSADGSGKYYDDGSGLTTVVIGPDGSGQYYRADGEDSLLTIDADGDGAGEYYRQTGGDLTTIVIDADGGWVLFQVTDSHRLEVAVKPDDSGRYTRTGLRPLQIDFDSSGLSTDGVLVELPDRPTLAVADRFPPLGRLGALSPPCAAVIRLDAALLFEFDEWSIRPEASTTLDEVAAALIDAGKPIEVNGHTDSLGTEEYNLRLSIRRAEAVEAALRSRGLTTPVKVNGFGETQPVADEQVTEGEDNSVARAKNRRVEIVVPEDG